VVVAIKVPDLGTTVDEVTLVAWLVEEGEPVKRGDLLAEIQTDKATTELESAAEGVLLKKVVPDNSTVRTGDILAYVGKPGESVPEVKPPAETAAPTTSVASASRPGSARVSPMVRNLAGKLGVDLSQVEGTGKGRMITREDVQRAAKAMPAAEPAAEKALPRSQAAVARAVLRSVRTIPHLRVNMSIDMSAAVALRANAKKAGETVSYDAVFLKAMAKALDAVPILAAKLEHDRITPPEGLHIAVTVSRGDELFLPVVRDVDKKGLPAVQREIADFAERAAKGDIRAEEMTDGCITLSNLGMYPIESFDAIIFPEHSAILSVGATQEKPVVAAGRVEIRPLANVTLSADHRLINGRAAAEFLSKVKEVIESGKLA